ncbi:MAG TPA: hypothetical protein VKW77_07295, partial [Acidimicrobiales bacterium]|nr:hypothetical protein [Acidimicrobiales bacterium]
MVFGARLAEAILAGRDGPSPGGVLAELPTGVLDDPAAEWRGSGGSGAERGVARGQVEVDRPDADVAKLRDRVQRAMTQGAGVLRSAGSLAAARAEVDAVAAAISPSLPDRSAIVELENLVTAARSLLTSAERREETRG